MLAFTISINIVSSSQNNQAGNEKKGIHIGKEEAKLSLFKDDIQVTLSNTGLNYEDALIHGCFQHTQHDTIRAQLKIPDAELSVAGPETHPCGMPRDGWDLCIKSKRFHKKLLRLIKKFSKLADYKINEQKSTALLYTKNENSKKEAKKNNSVHNSSKKNTTLRN